MDVLSYGVGTLAVGAIAYELTRPAPHASPVPASLACLGVGVIGLLRRRRV